MRKTLLFYPCIALVVSPPRFDHDLILRIMKKVFCAPLGSFAAIHPYVQRIAPQ